MGTVFFLVAPSVMLAVSSLSSGDSLTFPPAGISLRWFLVVAADVGMRAAFANSVVVSLLCTAICTVTGTWAALALVRYRLRFWSLLQLIFLLPFAVPTIVSAIGFLNVYGENDLLGRRWALAVALAAYNLPFMIAAVSAAAARLDPHLDAAAISCGARPVNRFFTVTLPCLAPGILSGAMLLFILAFNDYVVSSFLVDASSMTLPVAIFNTGRGATTPLLAAVSVIYTALSVLAIVVVDRLVNVDQIFNEQ